MSTVRLLFEMEQVEKALQRLVNVIPPEYEALGREAKVIQEAMTERRMAIEAIKGSAKPVLRAGAMCKKCGGRPGKHAPDCQDRHPGVRL